MSSNVTGTERGDSAHNHSHGGTAAGGWVVFAAVMMIFVGAMTLFQGIAGIAKDDVFVTTRNYVYQFSLTGWGWVHLILGIIMVLAGIALFKGALWARFIGVALAALGMIANFMWLPYYPFWAMLLIAIDVIVIWALCAAPRLPQS
ncbi:hypothetical protein OG462_20830 [Streptomyces sp. NBC_01077]|uniref:DUF7144 family membrane protein n=1 Tax=Streptomyces sp. NBC_01077 TaxID=2903746 RepID=UPI003867B460|nr:hypothetical protein OG462_20830 [Streptomyces sp. NBC_01077]